MADAVEAYRIEQVRMAKERAKQHRSAERELASIDRKIPGVVAGLESGGDPRALALRLNDLEAERRALLAQMPLGMEAQRRPTVSQKVADVHAALMKGDEVSREAITLVRDLIERISVQPTLAG